MDKKIGRREFFKKSAKIGISAAVGYGFAACAPGEKAVPAVYYVLLHNQCINCVFAGNKTGIYY